MSDGHRSMMAVGCALVIALTGCGDLTAPLPDEDIRLEIHVSGGFAGVSYSIELDGLEGVVRGLTCEAVCSFDPGEVFTTLSDAQVRRTGEELRAAGLLQLDGVDFGVQCCDQFEYVITYEDGDRASTVRGSSGALPPLLLSAIDRVVAMMDGRVPAIIAFESTPGDFPTDPLTIDDAQVSGHVLEAALTYGGGCQAHEIDLVAHGGWLESFPVQVNVFLSHEDNDDMCDALIIETRHFDLTPLSEAYRDAYGAGSPGATTLVLRLHDALDPSSVQLIEYTF